MKVLLTTDVKDLGKAGDIKDVADGYARNYLIKRNLATAATPQNIRRVEEQRQAQARRDEKLAQEFQVLAGKIDGVDLHFPVKVGENDRLYGSITNGDIARELSEKVGEEVDRRHVVLEDPIRELGNFQVPVRLGHGAKATVNVVVEKG